MKKLLLLLLFIVSTISYASDVSINVNPSAPVVGENFTVTFLINTESEDEPSISFNPLGAEVISKGATGVSTRTTFVNGKLSVERKLTVEYELIAQSAGEVFLRDIKIDLGGKTINHPTKRISIYNEKLKKPNVFVQAEVSKQEVFVNQSIVVRYYLYTKLNVANFEIKKFPQLDKFLKRYHDERLALERVEYEGELYNRKVIYTAQLYGQTPGDYTIDPISLMVQYSERGNDPFGGIGFGFSSLRSKTISSSPVKIKVKQLPIENVPKHFTGLVGKHQFSLKLNKNKFLVNEPIEIDFNVTGPGALELFESPLIISDANLEELVSNTDLKINQNFMATKSFDISYLGRGATSVAAKKIPFTYFDPDNEKFVTVELDFNGVEVVGGDIATPDKIKNEFKNTTTSQNNKSIEQVTDSNLAFIPIYKLSNTYRYQAKNITLILGFILFMVIGFRFRDYFTNRKYVAPSVLKIIKSQGVNYSNLFSLLSLIRQKDDTDLEEIIHNSDLSVKGKEYFQKLLGDCEKEFQKSSSVKNKEVNKKYLAEVEKILKKKNGSIS